MPETKKTEETPAPVADVQPATVSKQRQFAATATSAVVGVALGAVASYFISKVQVKVQNSINPPQPEATTDN